MAGLGITKDILVYTSEPLKESMAIAGPVKMKLFAATDGPDTDWVVKLIDVYPENDPKMPGFKLIIADEILRGAYHADPEKVAEAILEKAAKLVLQ